VYWGGQNLKQYFSKAPGKQKKKLRKNGNFSTKSILVFGITLKQMTVDT